MQNAIANMLLPPVGLVWLAILAVVAGRRWRMLALAALLGLLALGTPGVSAVLLASLDPAEPGTANTGGAAPQAVVILSGDAIRVAGDTSLDPGLLTLDRLRAGAAAARRTGLPVLVSGGRFGKMPEPLAHHDGAQPGG